MWAWLACVACSAEAWAADDSTIFVARRGWHIDVGFAAKDLPPPFSTVAADFPGVQFLFFGFGDRRYLMAKHHGPMTMLSAMWPGRALILATALAASPSEAFGGSQVVALRVTHAQLLAAATSVWGTFADTSIAPQASFQGPYAGSLYYDSRDTYSGIHTCNTWVAQILARAGILTHPRTILFAGQLWHRLAKIRGNEATQR